MEERETDQIHDAMMHLRSVARPLLFRTGVAEAPISTWGTCFLVGFEGRVFALTAAHLVGNAHSESILISPIEGSPLWLKLSNGFGMIGEADEDESEYDVIAYEVSLRPEIGPLGALSWLENADRLWHRAAGQITEADDRWCTRGLRIAPREPLA